MALKASNAHLQVPIRTRARSGTRNVSEATPHFYCTTLSEDFPGRIRLISSQSIVVFSIMSNGQPSLYASSASQSQKREGDLAGPTARGRSSSGG
jgi:hypothetical protein